VCDIQTDERQGISNLMVNAVVSILYGYCNDMVIVGNVIRANDSAKK